MHDRDVVGDPGAAERLERVAAAYRDKPILSAQQIEDEYRTHGMQGENMMKECFPNLFICPEPRLSLDRLEEILIKSELKLDCKPLLVLVDYAQLMVGKGNSKYERTSNVAEGLKQIAKATKTVIFITSQIDRTSAREANNSLHSAKDSGSLENSAGLVLAADRDPEHESLLYIRVLKATKGGTGLVIECDIDGARSRITERVKKQTEQQE